MVTLLNPSVTVDSEVVCPNHGVFVVGVAVFYPWQYTWEVSLYFLKDGSPADTLERICEINA